MDSDKPETPNVAATAVTASPPTAVTPTAAPVAVKDARPDPGFLLSLAFLFLLAFFLGSFRAINSDIWMTLAGGRLLANGQYHFGVDPFSWASDGAYWANASWLSSWLAYVFLQIAGPSSLIVIKGFLAVAIAGFVYAARPRNGPKLAALELTALALLAASSRFLLQPIMLSFVGLAILLWMLARHGFLDGDAVVPRRFAWPIPALFLVWSNFDAYFLIGLMTLAFLAIGLALSSPSRADAKRLGLVLVASVVACVLNPHGLANLTLPYDLAEIVIGILPPAWTPAGQTVTLMRVGDPNFFPAVSSFSIDAMTQPGYNANLAGLSFYILTLVNLASCIVAALALRQAPGRGTPSLGDVPTRDIPGRERFIARAFVCLGLAALAAIHLRLAPFYAIAAGVLSAYNFADLRRNASRDAVVVPRPASFAASMTLLALFVAVVFAWPGWLHLGFGQFHDESLFSSPRRVDWSLTPDPSLKDAALALKSQAKSSDGSPPRVFSGSLDIAPYLAYFAPEVQGGFDVRFALFPAKAADYALLRNDVYEDALFALRGSPPLSPLPGDPSALDVKRPDRRAAAKTLADWRVSALVVSGLRGKSRFSPLIFGLLQQSNLWTPILADGQTLAFLHRTGTDGPAPTLDDLWRREAFTPQPESDWLPGDSPQQPPREPTWGERFAYGPGVVPTENSTAQFRLAYYETIANDWIAPYFVARQLMTTLTAAGSVGGPTLGYQAAQNILYGDLFASNPRGTERTWFHSLDYGPPAVPILMRRDLRRSLAQNLAIADSWFLLAQAVKKNLHQEAWWNRHQQPTFRQDLRTLEIAAALQAAVTLAPDNPEYRLQLAEVLHTSNHRDAALIHFAHALQVLDAAPADETSLRRFYPGQYEQILQEAKIKEAQRKFADQAGQKFDGGGAFSVPAAVRARFEANRELMRKRYQKLEFEVKQRRDDLELKAAGASDMNRFRLAVRAPWRYSDLENKTYEDPRGRGLALEALTALERIDPKTLNEKDRNERTYFLVRLYCQQGRIAEAFEVYNRAKNEFGFQKVECVAMISVATGWTQNLDEALRVMEAEAVAITQEQIRPVIEFAGLGLGLSTLADESALARIFHGGMIERFLLVQRENVFQAQATLAELRMLRGLFLLERGDVVRARELFDTALSSDLNFPDRPIAERYRDLLQENDVP